MPRNTTSVNLGLDLDFGKARKERDARLREIPILQKMLVDQGVPPDDVNRMVDELVSGKAPKYPATVSGTRLLPPESVPGPAQQYTQGGSLQVKGESKPFEFSSPSIQILDPSGGLVGTAPGKGRPVVLPKPNVPKAVGKASDTDPDWTDLRKAYVSGLSHGYVSDELYAAIRAAGLARGYKEEELPTPETPSPEGFLAKWFQTEKPKPQDPKHILNLAPRDKNRTPGNTPSAEPSGNTIQDKAIKWLEDNGQKITPGNIKAVIDKGLIK